jgi:hypothetical protein
MYRFGARIGAFQYERQRMTMSYGLTHIIPQSTYTEKPNIKNTLKMAAMKPLFHMPNHRRKEG